MYKVNEDMRNLDLKKLKLVSIPKTENVKTRLVIHDENFSVPLFFLFYFMFSSLSTYHMVKNYSYPTTEERRKKKEWSGCCPPQMSIKIPPLLINKRLPPSNNAFQ